MASHFEIIISGRQMAVVIAAGALLVLVAFGLGVGVGLQQRESPPATIVAAPAWPTVPPLPTPGPEPEPTVVPVTSPVPAIEPPAREVVVPERTRRAVSPTNAAGVPTARAGVATSRPGTTAGRWVQVAVLSHKEQAEGVRQRVMAVGFEPRQVALQAAADGKYRVRVGPFPDDESARRVAARLQANGFPGAFVAKE